MQLIPGDRIHVGGGIRKASKNHNRILNLEFLEILTLKQDIRKENPKCKKCNKKMKSKGKNQGYQCLKCGKKSSHKVFYQVPRNLMPKMYLPDVSAHRHLTRPVQRMRITNKEKKFDTKIQWCKQYRN